MSLNFSEFVRLVWEHKPLIIILTVAGAIIFILLIIDTHRHRKERKARRQVKKLH